MVSPITHLFSMFYVAIHRRQTGRRWPKSTRVVVFNQRCWWTPWHSPVTPVVKLLLSFLISGFPGQHDIRIQRAFLLTVLVLDPNLRQPVA